QHPSGETVMLPRLRHLDPADSYNGNGFGKRPLMSPALRRQAMTIVATLATAYVASHFFRAANVTIGLDLMRDLQIGPQALGALTGAFFFGFSAMQIPCGFFLDRFGPRRTVCGMLLV